jgi:integrase
MSASADRTPKYRHYKPKNLGVVRIDGRDFYLGKFGSPESWEKYHRLLAERYARGSAAPVDVHAGQAESESLIITELVVRYYRHCENYYIKNGKQTGQVAIIKLALKVLRALYGSSLAKEFSPLALKACRAEMVKARISRRECNRRTRLIKQAFRWGVSEELVPPSVYHGLTTVVGLEAGRCDAPDPEPIGPVPEAIVERTLEHCTPTVEAMARLQLASGMRPGEVCDMRACDLNTSGVVWEYRPADFKTAHHARASRVVMLGPKAQEILRPFLALKIGAYLFSPRQSEAERNQQRRAERKTPLWPSHVKHQAVKKRKRPGRKAAGERWYPNAYRKAIAQACDAAFPHPVLAPLSKRKLTDAQPLDLKAWREAHRWHPNQLRHTAATLIRRRFGAEAAQAVLGHAQLSTTEIYAEKSLDAARHIMKEIG